MTRELVAAGIVVGANVAVNRLPGPLVVPAALGSAGLLTAVARGAGVPWSEMGMDAGSAGPGVRWGAWASLPIAAGLAAGVAVPSVRRILADRDAVESGGGAALRRVLLTIPLGTAVPEEVIFRGALPGILARGLGRWGAAVAASVLFGLWHVLPTREQLRTHPYRGAARGREDVVVATMVAVTGLAGGWFWWLRQRSGSLIAPVVAHATGNVASFLGGRLAARMLGLRS